MKIFFTRTLPVILTLTAAEASAASAAAPVAASRLAAGSVSGAGDSVGANLSADGRHVVFVSSADNLVPNDHNRGARDVFVRDLVTGVTRLVSVATNGLSGNGPSGSPVISADGSQVAFVSQASDLVSGDTNGLADVFLRDLVTGETMCPSRSAAGVPANRASDLPAISPDGRYVSFESRAYNLIANDTNGYTDVLMFDRQTRSLRRISAASTNAAISRLAPGESAGAVMSDDGRTVVFASAARTLAPAATRGAIPAWSGVLVLRPPAESLRMLDLFPDTLRGGVTTHPQEYSLSADGRYLGLRVVPFPSAGLSNAFFFADLDRGVVRAIPASYGIGTNEIAGPVVTADGRRMIFGAREPGKLYSVFAWDAESGEVTRISEPPPAVSGLITNVAGWFLGASRDGEFVAFVGRLPADPEGLDAAEQLLVRRVSSGELRRVSRRLDGSPVPGANWLGVSFSDDGRRLVFPSSDPGLVAGDGNDASDVFLYDWDTDSLRLVSGVSDAAEVAATGAGSAGIVPGALSSDGRRLVFESSAAGWVANDTNRAPDVLMRDQVTGEVRLVSVRADGGGTGNGASREGVISADGRWVAFASVASDLVEGDANGARDIFVRDLEGVSTVLASRRPDGHSAAGGARGFAISPDGRRVAFESASAEIVPGAIAATQHLFLFDQVGNAVTLVSTNAPGLLARGGASGSPVFSPDGRWLVFESTSPNLLPEAPGNTRKVVALEFATGRLRLLAPPDSGVLSGLQFLSPPPLAVFAPDSSGVIFVQRPAAGPTLQWYPFATGELRRIAGDARLGGLSRDGTRVAFRAVTPWATESARVRVIDQVSGGVLTEEDGGLGTAGSVGLTPDGRFLVFSHPANGPSVGEGSGPGGVFLRDLKTGTMVLLSASADGWMGDGPSGAVVLSADGSTAAFASFAGNLIAGDYNRQSDVFVVRLPGPESDFRVTALSRSSTGEVRLFWAARAGATYRVQAAAEPTGPWADLALQPLVLVGKQAMAVDAGAAGQSRRFYRVVDGP